MCTRCIHTTSLHNPAALNMLVSIYVSAWAPWGSDGLCYIRMYICTYVHTTDCNDPVSRIHIMSTNHAQSNLTHRPNLTHPPTHPPLSVPVLSLLSELPFVDCCRCNLPASLKMAVVRRSVLTRPHRAAAMEGSPMRARTRFCLLVLSTSMMSCRMRSVFFSRKPFN